MARTKKIYKYVDRMVKRCEWCEGTGRNLNVSQICGTCKGTGGEWKRVRVLVSEEVVE
jgi:DnaJ-class molecular chaperone